jgi:hypothetical protein
VKLAFIISYTILSATLNLAQNNSTQIQSLIEADRDFCQISRIKTTRQVFIAVLPDDVILFRLQPVNGKNWTNENPDAPGLLT